MNGYARTYPFARDVSPEIRSGRVGKSLPRRQSGPAQRRVGRAQWVRLARCPLLSRELSSTSSRVELPGDEGQCREGDASSQEEGETVAGGERSVGVVGAGGSDRGEQSEPDCGTGLLACHEQAAGKALVAAFDAAGDRNRRGRQRQADAKGREQQPWQDGGRVARPHGDLGEP